MNIPLIRARYPNAFGHMLYRMGVQPESLYEKARLPASALERPDVYLPIPQFHRFLDLAVTASGTLNLGFHAAQTDWANYGDFGQYLLSRGSLYRAIKSFCERATAEYSKADFYLRHDRNRVWFCRGPIDGGMAIQKRQTELYVLVMMIQTIQLAAGDDWVPPAIFLQTRCEDEFGQLPLLTGTNIRFGNAVLAIELPQQLLSRPLQLNAGNLRRGWKVPPRQPAVPADSFTDSLRNLLIAYMDSGYLNIEVAAELAGVSVRTLQRRLATECRNYSSVLEQARFEVVLPLIENTDHKLTEIAFELGYKDASHLARSFRRWAGMTPSEFRQQRFQATVA